MKIIKSILGFPILMLVITSFACYKENINFSYFLMYVSVIGMLMLILSVLMDIHDK